MCLPLSLQTVILTKMDLKLALPQTVINFILRNIAGMFLYLLQQHALKVLLLSLLLSPHPSLPPGRLRP
jgi:hypothetical protein